MLKSSKTRHGLIFRLLSKLTFVFYYISSRVFASSLFIVGHSGVEICFVVSKALAVLWSFSIFFCNSETFSNSQFKVCFLISDQSSSLSLYTRIHLVLQVHFVDLGLWWIFLSGQFKCKYYFKVFSKFTFLILTGSVKFKINVHLSCRENDIGELFICGPRTSKLWFCFIDQSVLLIIFWSVTHNDPSWLCWAGPRIT